MATILKLTYCSAHLAASKELEIPKTKAGETTKFKLPASILKHTQMPQSLLTIRFRLRNSTKWAQAGHEIAWVQHTFTGLSLKDFKSHPPRSSLQVSSSKTTHTVKGIDFSFAFDRSRGVLKTWTHNTSTLLAAKDNLDPALKIGFNRCPTDNDRPEDFLDWQRYGIDDLRSQLRDFSLNQVSDTEVQLVSKTFISPPILAWGFDATTTYTIFGDGKLSVKVNLVPVGGGKLPKHLPRIGLDIRASLALETSTWFGLGPGESYPDTKASQKIGLYDSLVKDLGVEYEVPQENGNRLETNWLKLYPTAGGYGIRATRFDSEQFAWQIGRYKDAVLEQARHPRDLIGQEEDALLWRLDVATAGVGTAACGPGVREEYSVKVEETNFEFMLESVLY